MYKVEVKAIGGWTLHSEHRSYRDAVDQADMVRGRVVKSKCSECGDEYVLSRTCGACICVSCGNHDKLVRCFCGWSISGRNGREELEEMGETIDEI